MRPSPKTVLNIVSDWCEKNELSINPVKAKMILFIRKRKIEGLKIPIIKGIPITLVDIIKYLGIILDSKMLWIANIDLRIEKSTIALWQCSKAYSSSWALSPKVILDIYNNNKTYINLCLFLMESHIQRKACIAITGAWKSTPTAALEAMLNLPPLHIHIQTEAISALSRIHRSQGPLRETNHTSIWLDNIRKDPALTMPTYRNTH